MLSQGGFSAGHSGLSLLNRGEHAFTEIRAFPLRHAPVEGISELAHGSRRIALHLALTLQAQCVDSGAARLMTRFIAEVPRADIMTRTDWTSRWL